jgi:hypothetical protein
MALGLGTYVVAVPASAQPDAPVGPAPDVTAPALPDDEPTDPTEAEADEPEVPETAEADDGDSVAGSEDVADEVPAPPPPAPPQPAAAPPPPQEATQPELPPREDPFATSDHPAKLFPQLSVPIQFDGFFWVDTGYMERSNAQSGQYDQSAAYMQGRFVLGATYYQEKRDLFGLARVQFLGLVNEYSKSQYEPHTLDAYLQAGFKNKFDVQLGRFLAWEVYHRGQGIELYTAEEAGALDGPTLYWLNRTRGHHNEAGQAAIHLYPWEFLKFEVAGVYGQESNQNNFGVRPVVDFSVGGLQLIGGYEYLTKKPQTNADKVENELHGAAAKLQYRFPIVTAGANIAYTDVSTLDINGDKDAASTYTKMSAGGFVDIDFWINSIGLGYHHTTQDNEQKETTTHDQMFVSYLIQLPIDGLALKAVYGFATAEIEDSDADSKWTNNMNSFRVRASYDFQ